MLLRSLHPQILQKRYPGDFYPVPHDDGGEAQQIRPLPRADPHLLIRGAQHPGHLAGRQVRLVAGQQLLHCLIGHSGRLLSLSRRLLELGHLGAVRQAHAVGQPQRSCFRRHFLGQPLQYLYLLALVIAHMLLLSSE